MFQHNFSKKYFSQKVILLNFSSLIVITKWMEIYLIKIDMKENSTVHLRLNCKLHEYAMKYASPIRR